MKYTMVNPQTGGKKIVKKGFSWKTFFFGGLYCLARGDWKWFFMHFLTFGLVGFYLIFKYNDIIIAELEEKGFKFQEAS